MAAATFVNADPKVNPNAVLMDNETGNTEMEKPTYGFLPGAIDPTPYEAFARWSNTIGRECDIGLPICRPQRPKHIQPSLLLSQLALNSSYPRYALLPLHLNPQT
jgi:hypothetical protein